ncbi:DNA replication/repair protein RecF [Paramagnetospirillum kuznetsovii]|uniref:DNA replication/repair protein RecF n=1 Tax=Paramagnetospirillum kuznetsovii TaxID=2053833 RepID=UPI001EFE312E|nr:DNA replication/repair protein RecF [Paramagnetospirillum kuznetsovii]
MISGTGPGRLAIRRLSLADFRCYSQLRLDTQSRPVVLTGPNGAGKTNLLEALSFLVPGRGMRRASLGEIARHGSGDDGSWAVAAVLEDGGEIGTGREAGNERRSVRLDGQPAKPADLAARLSALWLTPAMDRLFSEGAGGRRRFLDRLAFGIAPGHAREASAYEHAMRERSRLLKVRREGGAGDPSWLAALEDGMARHGVAVAANRVRAATLLDEACRRGIGPFPAARLAVVGEVEGWLVEGQEPPQAEDGLRSALTRARARDEAAGCATMGPHRSDLAVRHAAKDLAVGQCSTGEQKAVLVAIVLAQSRVQAALTGRAPLLLLDEVVAHLDQVRRAALFDELCVLGAQSWMTGTDELLFDGFGDRAQFFRVAEASVTPREV